MTAIPVVTVRDSTSEALSRVDGSGGAPIWPAEAASAELLVRAERHAWIARDGGIRAARVAFACVIRPEPGDLVLTSLAAGVIWIVSILERRSDLPPCLWADGDLGIVSECGDISLSAAGAVEIGAGARARIGAPEIELHAGVARFVLDELLQIGRRVTWYVSKLRSVSEMVETLAEHVLTRAARSSRFIEESDQMRAGAIDHRAEGTLQLEAEVAFVTAGTIVRVDADQIHMG